jgi:WD40 repeat protein
VVTALAADPAGSRLLAGSRDYTLRMFDFNGMNSTMRSFRSLEPSEGHPVHALSWSPTGQTSGPFFLFSSFSFVALAYRRELNLFMGTARVGAVLD